MTLSARDTKFVAEYLKDLNATKAILRCGYKGKNARVVGPRTYAKVGVREAIDAELAKIHKKGAVTQERILAALMAVAEFDPRKVFHSDGTMKKISELPDDVASAIASMESDDLLGRVKKLRFWDKVRALELLGKHLKMFSDNEGLGTLGGGPILFQMVPANYESTPDSKNTDDKGL